MSALVRAGERSLKKHALIAFLSIILVLGGFIVWAATTEISGAVTASGKIVVDDRLKNIQHLEGGVVKEIHVRNGQGVAAGDVLLVLDTMQSQATLESTTAKYQEALLRRARLQAETAGLTEVALPQELADVASDPAVITALAVQNQILGARASGRTSQTAQITQQIKQFQEQISGLESQRNGAASQLTELHQSETNLKENGKTSPTAAMNASRISEIRIQIAGLESQRATFTASIAQIHASIAEYQFRAEQIEADSESETLRELEPTETSITELAQQLATAKQKLAQGTLKSPVSGTVHQSTVDTIGGVILPGQTVMTIVPNTALTAEVHIKPQDIDSVRINSTIRLRISSFDQRTTPEIPGKVTRLSPDTTPDQSTGESHFTATIEIAETANLLPPDASLMPGMPVEAYVLTHDRTVMTYLLKPLQDQLDRAFRED